MFGFFRFCKMLEMCLMSFSFRIWHRIVSSFWFPTSIFRIRNKSLSHLIQYGGSFWI